MSFFKNPGWIDKELQRYASLDEVPSERLAEIRDQLSKAVSEKPIVSIIIAAWNEELNIIRCLDSLSKNKSEFPFEIIVINNNSTDRTQQVLDQLGIISYVQAKQGVGPSRELGQRHAKGKYILSADADCVYPEKWVSIMTKALMQKGVVFVFGKFSYIADNHHSRPKLSLFETLRDVVAELRNFKRPHLNTYGISLGYIKEYGLIEGHLDKNMRGFDGRLCFDMMKYGKVKMVRSSQARVWTGTRALDRDGNFPTAVIKRVLREFARFDDYFSKPEQHNTKESRNADYSVDKSIQTIKKKLNPFQPIKK